MGKRLQHERCRVVSAVLYCFFLKFVLDTYVFMSFHTKNRKYILSTYQVPCDVLNTGDNFKNK